MISTKEQVVSDLAELNDEQLKEVAEFLDFLKFRKRRKFETQFDDVQLEALYAEFAEEDRELAEAGLDEYAANLAREDVAQ
jgi:outer membrane protein assembly factor BamD (BamD/ComL family)